MAVRFDAATDKVTCTDTVADPADGFTLTAWAYLSVDTNTYSTFARLFAGATTATLATGENGTDGPAYFSGGGSITATTDFVAGEWRRIAFTCTGTSGTVYAATPEGSTEVVTGTVVGAADPTGITLGGRSPSDDTEWFNGRLAYVRLWSSVLTQGEVEAEWASASPVVTAGLWADWPLGIASDLTDHSGNGRDLAAGSTAVTTEDGPPITTAITGDLAATAPAGTAALAGHVVVAGGMVAAAPAGIAVLAGEVTVAGILAAAAPVATAAAVGEAAVGGVLGGIAPAALAALAGAAPIVGSFAVIAPAATFHATSGTDYTTAEEPTLTIRTNQATATVRQNGATATTGDT